ncbi:MAG: hypothetical protein N2691_02140 [Patescibacteria group bacterium]|nr:hypothetical protein [Patescibacteria group bacterium]
MAQHERTVGLHTGIRQESAAAFRVPPDKLAASGGGSATGGAAPATVSMAEAFALHAEEVLANEGYHYGVDVLLDTPYPYRGYDPAEAGFPENMRTFMYGLPRHRNGSPASYDDMIRMYKRRAAQMAAMKAEFRAMVSRGPTFSLGHFYVDLAVRRHVLAELAQYGPVIPQYGAFHSALADQIKLESPGLYAALVESGNLTRRRIQAERVLIASNITMFSTEAERQMTIQALTGKKVNGRILTTEYLEARTLVVPLTIDSDQFSPEDPMQPNRKRNEQRKAFLGEYGIALEDFVIGGVMRLDAEKGYDEFARGFIEFLEEFENLYRDPTSRPRVPKLFIAGGVPNKPGMQEKYEALLKRIREFEESHPKYQGHIIIPNTAFHHGKIANAFDWLVGPSLSETFHLAPKEANAAGVPVALTNIAAHHETHGHSAIYFDLVKEDRNGVFTPDTQSIIEVIQRMLDPQIRDYYAKAGIINSQRFSKHAVAELLVKDMLSRYPHQFEHSQTWQ